jgi:glucose/arabinose dehydrogenase
MKRSPLKRIAAGLVIALLCAGSMGCSQIKGWAANKRDREDGIQLGSLRAPGGHEIFVFAQGLPKARHMAMGARTLFVGSTEDAVYAISIDDKGEAGVQRKVITGLRGPSGVAFHAGALYVADRTRILRYDNIEGWLDNPPKPVVVVDGLPDEKRHSAHAMNFGPDGKLYISVGSPCDVCEPINDEYGTIVRVNRDGSGKEIVARGIRNSVGFDWHPGNRELWFTENGQDGLGPERPNDELNKVSREGEHFGFPYCHDKDIADTRFTARQCPEFTPPQLPLGAHVAALGMRFDPVKVQGGDASILVARHGSHPPLRVAYDVQRVVIQNGVAVRMEPFLTGFLHGGKFWGRPVDVLIMRDGSVLISDDLNGAIYRVTRVI